MDISADLLLSNVTQDLLSQTSDSPERTWRGHAASALVSSLLKKFVERQDADADKRALDLFIEVNDRLPDCAQVESLTDEYLLGELKKELYRFWYIDGMTPLVSHLSEIFEFGRCGPGSSLGCQYGDAYSKLFNSKLTASRPDLCNNYRERMLDTPLSSEAEKLRHEHFGCDTNVTHNKLLFVPKRDDISRTICVEPIVNMFYQLGFGSILESRLKSFYRIDLGTQPFHNRELARQGSIDQSFATIDLSSASDSMSCGVLKEILPPSFYRWLEILRVPQTLLPSGELLNLRMISTMGNGFTFPLETILFSSIVNVCYRLSGLKATRNIGPLPGQGGNWGVFGDDIIVLKEVFFKVMRLLTILGFKANADKTFCYGPFRESCGGDFFEGHSVRAVYIKSLTSAQDRYVAINLLNDWSAMTGLTLPLTIKYLLKSVKWLAVPPYFGLDEGLHLPLSLARPSIRIDRNLSFLAKKYSVRSRGFKVSEDGSVVGRDLINPSGLIISLLTGHIRSHTIGRRQNRPRYTMKTVSVPNWNLIQVCRSYRRFNFTQWETAVFFNTI